MEREVQSWRRPWIVVVLYPGLLLAFDDAINGYHRSGSVAMAFGALLTMLLATSIPPLALRALLMTRHEVGPVLRRGMLYLMFSVPTLFSLSFTLSRLAGSSKAVFFAIWISAWLAVGLMLYLKGAH